MLLSAASRPASLTVEGPEVFGQHLYLFAPSCPLGLIAEAASNLRKHLGFERVLIDSDDPSLIDQ